MKIAIFACAAALFFCGCDRTSGDAALQRVQIDMQSISTTLKMYNYSNGHYPSTAQGLQALVVMPTGETPQLRWAALMEKVPLDPWAQEYRYEYGQDVDGKKQTYQFRIISTGKDLQLGTEDDIVHEVPLTKGS